MSITSFIGLFLGSFVFLYSLKLATPNNPITIFMDYPSAFIVLGGTFTSAAISYKISHMFMLFKIFIKHVAGAYKVNYAEVIAEIMKIGDAYRRGESLESHINKVNDFFMKEALELINDGILEGEHLTRILTDRANNMNYMHLEDAGKIKYLAQYPPAMGALGTTIGMIVLLANLGGEDAMKMIGPAMGFCLITTMYGSAISNLFVIPVSENLIEASKIGHVKNLIIIEGVKHILSKSNPVIVAEELNSYLPPRERLDWKEIIGK
ncbi:MAG: hypothetical protein A2X86_05300 [Bdellovibrionales bacterium GWA2_49_15]|nr:MAG: hypothetical protein A2X86_05300 [Bdellovibrionales bacterium GWA2_49_15]